MTFQVAFDCIDPRRMGRFWSRALGYTEAPPPKGYPSWPAALAAMHVPPGEWDDGHGYVDPSGRRPKLAFQRVPGGRRRVHLDLNACNEMAAPMATRRRVVEAEVERLTGLGATAAFRSQLPHHYHVTMTDPEGNEFCVR